MSTHETIMFVSKAVFGPLAIESSWPDGDVVVDICLCHKLYLGRKSSSQRVTFQEDIYLIKCVAPFFYAQFQG